MTQKRLVLNSFKILHKTRKNVFQGDERALDLARNKINEEYHKNKHVTNPDAIDALLQFSREVDHELRTIVIQAREVEPGIYRARLSPETLRLENKPYNDSADIDSKPRGNSSCCKELNKG